MTTAECFSCGRPATHQSPNTRVKLCDRHVRSLPGTSTYVPILPPAQTAATEEPRA